jgi:pyrroline-5-carboxylate reductase
VTIRVVEPAAERRAWLLRQFKLTVHAELDPAAADSDAVVLAVKPQQIREVCVALRPHLEDQVVVSIAAGIRARDLARWLGTQRIVRAMPNTPALIGRGISGVTALDGAGPRERRIAETVLAAVGRTVWVADDAQIDAVTAVSGSGPAYVFYFIEALTAAAEQVGLGPLAARELAIETFAGAALLAAQSDEPAEALRAKVTSKGGTTAAAIASLEAAGVKARVGDAVNAAYRRAIELGDAIGRDR